jgi:hypothetical protein
VCSTAEELLKKPQTKDQTKANGSLKTGVKREHSPDPETSPKRLKPAPELVKLEGTHSLLCSQTCKL